MNQGLYEELVTKLISHKLSELDKDVFQVKQTPIDRAEAAQILSQHIGKTIRHAFNLIKTEDVLETQIEIANKIIVFLRDELKREEFDGDLIETEGKILKAVFTKIDAHFTDLDVRLKEITPYTRLIHSELFTGGNSGTTLESELRKEILSSDKIDLLVSFIKWKGIRILERELREFTARGGKLRVITTTYIGATDAKAVEFLSTLENTQVKVSYNTGNERLHAKAYLFQRNTGFNTAYIGSSNFSRSALTDGLEWNLKVTTKEVGHIIDKFKKTFEAYWQNPDFELYSHAGDSVKLTDALKQGKFSKENTLNLAFFDIKPFHYQSEILEKLEVERLVHNRFRNLIVAATGTGKTVISAFDYKKFRTNHKSSRLLFVAHRKEILQQALSTFRMILKEGNDFGDLWVDGIQPTSNEYVFASVQTLKNRLSEVQLSPEYYDYIIIDEVHHISASTYRPIINYFKPKVLLGLTATPERMDGEDILADFCNRIAAEIRLPEALNKKLLSPFQYFGITDSIDLSNVKWENGKYAVSELTRIYTKNDIRVGQIISNLYKYTSDIHDVRAIGFCVSIEHATFMTEKFCLAGLKAACLTAKNTSERDGLRERFRKKEFNYLFVVDIFNEGVDIPEIDTVLFLRPTESLTVFLQQLGRGLRLAEGKDCLTVLDFVGNSRPEYDFESKFRALIGKTTTSVQKEIEDDFPHLPLGCSIVLEKKTKQTILENIKRATSLNKNQLIAKIRNFKYQTTLTLSLHNFMELNAIPIEAIYKKGTWSRLCYLAGVLSDLEDTNEKQIEAAISKKWLATRSTSYFSFILKLAKQGFHISSMDLDETEKAMMLMLHYDVWQTSGSFATLEESIRAIGNNSVFVDEIISVLEILKDRIDFKEVDIKLPYKQPLKVHARYTRDQILAAFGLSTFEKKSSSREGVAENVALNTELLFINLIKSEENFSPTTMYDDYAISETLFHWQSQNSSRPEIGRGLSYIQHQKNHKKILLFVREKANNEFGNTMGYVFIGEASFQENEGSKPMNIKWELNEPIPSYLWNASAKMSIG